MVNFNYASICSIMPFSPFGSSDVVVWVSINFLPNSKQDAPFHCIACDYSHVDWDSLCDHLRDVLWKDIFKLSVLLLVNVLSGFRLELIYISFIIKIRSSLTHLHGFQMLVLLPPPPCVHRNHLFVCTNIIHLLNLR